MQTKLCFMVLEFGNLVMDKFWNIAKGGRADPDDVFFYPIECPGA